VVIHHRGKRFSLYHVRSMTLAGLLDHRHLYKQLTLIQWRVSRYDKLAFSYEVRKIRIFLSTFRATHVICHYS